MVEYRLAISDVRFRNGLSLSKEAELAFSESCWPQLHGKGRRTNIAYAGSVDRGVSQLELGNILTF
jgi:hypothetical protein